MKLHKQLDRMAIFLSGLCAVHCIVLPIAASLLPLISGVVSHGHDIHNLWFHQLILFIVLPISLVALMTGYNCHRAWPPVFITLCGLIILAIPAMFFDTLHEAGVLSHSHEMMLTLTGGVIHAIGHILNIQSTRHSHAISSS